MQFSMMNRAFVLSSISTALVVAGNSYDSALSLFMQTECTHGEESFFYWMHYDSVNPLFDLYKKSAAEFVRDVDRLSVARVLHGMQTVPKYAECLSDRNALWKVDGAVSTEQQLKYYHNKLTQSVFLRDRYLKESFPKIVTQDLWTFIESQLANPGKYVGRVGLWSCLSKDQFLKLAAPTVTMIGFKNPNKPRRTVEYFYDAMRDAVHHDNLRKEDEERESRTSAYCLGLITD
jgi:hypothetical protein